MAGFRIEPPRDQAARHISLPKFVLDPDDNRIEAVTFPAE